MELSVIIKFGLAYIGVTIVILHMCAIALSIRECFEFAKVMGDKLVELGVVKTYEERMIVCRYSARFILKFNTLWSIFFPRIGKHCVSEMIAAIKDVKSIGTYDDSIRAMHGLLNIALTNIQSRRQRGV